MRRKKYYLHRRNSIFYAELTDPISGQKLTAKSTGESNRDDALVVVSDWLRNGIPLRNSGIRQSATETFTIKKILSLIKTTELSPSDTERIVVQIFLAIMSDYPECANADIVVITVGAKQKPGESRLALAGRNAEILKGIVPLVTKSSFSGVLLIVSNPVDVLTHIAWKISGLPAGRVIDSETVLDSARLRSILSGHCGVDARNIHAMIIGEHGDFEVAVWSLVSIGGVPIREYCNTCSLKTDRKDHFRVFFEEVKHAAYEIIIRKGATFYAIGLRLYRLRMRFYAMSIAYFLC
ncbi:MAG: hypothetical protein V1874_13850 [Spirochaetota bacterium]